jgi:hypothetical protein
MVPSTPLGRPYPDRRINVPVLFVSCMRARAIILSTLVLAFVARPLQLPAASCILLNAPSQEGCKPNCCANKSCCAVSKKSTTPISPPLVKSSDAGQQLLIGFVPISLIDSVAGSAFVQTPCVHIPVRAHSPPPLAATCIRLI